MYVIYYSGLFSHGYVKLALLKREKELIPFQTHQQVLEWATKFRFKIVAHLFCRTYNFISKKNYEFFTFEVRKIDKKVAIKKPVSNFHNN